jgi:hypothetical protein
LLKRSLKSTIRKAGGALWLVLAPAVALATEPQPPAAKLLGSSTAIYVEVTDMERCGALPTWDWLMSVAGWNVRGLPGAERCHLVLACEAGWQNPIMLVGGLAENETEVWERALAEPLSQSAHSKNGPLHVARCGDWLAVSRVARGVEASQARATGNGPSLASEDEYQDARQRSGQSVAWCFVRPEPLQGALRAAGWWGAERFPVLHQAWDELARPLIHSPYVAFSLAEQEHGLQLAVVTPGEVGSSTDGLRVVGGLLDEGQALAPLLPTETMLSASMYVSREALEALNRLVTRQLSQRMAKSPADRALLEAGMPLIQDILNQMRPEVQVVLARPSFEAGVAPQMRLPAVAVVFRPREPAKVKNAFILSYLGTLRQSNQRARAAEGPTLVMTSEKRGDGFIAGARYRSPAEDPHTRAGMFEYNLWPAMGVAGDRFILSSNYRLVEELVDLAQKQPDIPLEDNLQVNVGFSAATAWLADNLGSNLGGEGLVGETGPLWPGLTGARSSRTWEVPTPDLRGALRYRLRLWRQAESEL